MFKRSHKQQRRRELAVRYGAFLAVFVGVVTQALVVEIDFKTLSVELNTSAIGFSQMGVAAVGALFVYRSIRGRINEENIAQKADYAWNILWVALTQGMAIVALVTKFKIGG